MGRPGAPAGAEKQRRLAGFLDRRLSFGLLLGVALLAPLPVGSVGAFWVALWCAVLALALVFADPSGLRGRRAILLLPVLLAALAYFGVAALQMTPGLFPAPAWDAARALAGIEAAPVRVLSRVQAWQGLGPPLALLTAFLLAYAHGADRARAARLLGVVAWSGVAYAGFGVLLLLLDPAAATPWRSRAIAAPGLAAPFANRNTAACFYGGCAGLWLAQFLVALRWSVPAGIAARDALALVLAQGRARLAIPGFGFAVCALATLMTGSRAGTLLMLAALALVALWAYRDRLRRASSLAALAAMLALFGALLLELWGGLVAERVDRLGFSDVARAEVYRIALGMIADHPWLGVGLGSFEPAFAPRRTDALTIWGRWDLLHSTPLEIAVEMGLPVALLLAAVWVLLAARLARGALHRRRDAALPAGALAFAAVGTLHSCIDFSLQIPGYAIVFAIVAGAGLAQSFSSQERPEASAVAAARSGPRPREADPRGAAEPGPRGR